MTTHYFFHTLNLPHMKLKTKCEWLKEAIEELRKSCKKGTPDLDLQNNISSILKYENK